MAFEQNFQEPAELSDYDADFSRTKKWNSFSAPSTPSENLNGCFDCNICLESAHDPVVTLCGHLYCWPCIYRWLHVQSSSLDLDEQPKCPVCKTNISSSSLVPLYGRGTPGFESEASRHSFDVVVPHRPPPPEVNSRITTATSANSFEPQPHLLHHQQYFSPFPMPPTDFGGNTMTGLYSPSVNVSGGLVFARVAGGSDSNLFAYPYTNAYAIGGPRMRRQELEVDKSLSRVSIFLFCCLVLCLLLF